jgi:triacylglycerol esterase/lipase EstA (alpha/beta hydrolase family)
MTLRLALASLIAVLALATNASAAGFAPPDKPGPELSVPVKDLKAALECTPGVAGASHNPILLVPGTNLDPESNFSWNYERAFKALGRPYCTVKLPFHTMGDVQVAGEYVVYAMRTMAHDSGRKVDVLGFSQGGMLPRWALRFWPDTRALVGDVVGLDPSNHGTLDSAALCQASCPPAYWQQATGSKFNDALNSSAETFAGIDYTVVYSRTDEVVTPNLDATGSSSLHTGNGRIANVAVQEICPNDVSEHLAMGSYDPVGYALAIDAFTHDGPADASRIGTDTCAQPFQPGVDPATFATDYAGYLAAVGTSSAASPLTSAEPELKCYTTATCPTVQQVPKGHCRPPGRIVFHIHQHRKRVTRVRVYVNGKLVRLVVGRRVTRVSIGRPSGKRFTVRVVAVTANGQRVVSTRAYRGCSKGRAHTHIRRG